jgi:hypothetical protein
LLLLITFPSRLLLLLSRWHHDRVRIHRVGHHVRAIGRNLVSAIVSVVIRAKVVLIHVGRVTRIAIGDWSTPRSSNLPIHSGMLLFSRRCITRFGIR